MLNLQIDFTKHDTENVVKISTDNIRKEIESILLRVHTQSQKQEVVDRDGGFNIACPFCGDSKDNPNKKRGNIYLDTNTFKCYNCTIWMPLEEFFLKFNSDVGFKIAKFDLENFVSKTKTKISLYDIYDIGNQYIERGSLMKEMKLKNIVDDYKTAKYLESRKIDINDRRLAVNSFSRSIVFFNMHDDKVIGLQKRIHEPTNGNRFISYDYGSIMEKIIKSDYDKDRALKIKRISLLYNILNVDFSKKINTFESSIDSHHFTNSIACWGSNSILKLPNCQYGMDDDVAGRKASIKLLKSGYKVFMWGEFKHNNTIYRNCKDFNDIFKLKPISQKTFESYLTDSELDIISL